MALTGGRRQGGRWCAGLALLAVACSSGCHRVWRATTTQPPPLLGVGLEARTSLPAVIEVGDMRLPGKMRLENSATFVVVSKDRLRVHVVLRQKAEDLCDPRRWRVTLIDSLGRRYDPAGFDRREVKPVTLILNQLSVAEEQYYQGFGQPITFYRGIGDYSFYRRGLYRHDVDWMMLVLSRPGYEYRYLWTFVADPDGVAPANRIARRPAEL